MRSQRKINSLLNDSRLTFYMIEGNIVNYPKYTSYTAGEIRIPEERLPPYPPKILRGVEEHVRANHG